MSPARPMFAAVGVLLSAGALTAAGPLAASGQARPPAAVKPVIGKPVTTPAHALSGKRFTVSFRVVRSDTRAPLTRGRMVLDPTIAGKPIRHVESFQAGKARASFVVPANAAGKVLRVKATITTGRRSATRVATFRVLRGTPLPALSIGDATVVEGNTDTTTLSFPVTLSAADAQTVTVRYATADGTATAPADYAAASGKLTFSPGATTRTITVEVVADRAIEPNESLTITLSSPTNARIAASATGTITDDDVRSGHYAGTTSQGLPVTFDVTPDVREVQNLKVGIDWTCVEAPVKLFSNQLWVPAYPVPITADLSFQFELGFADASGSESVAFSGKLSPPGKVSGAFRQVDISYQNVWGIAPLHCSTGDVTWSAS